MKIKSTLRNCEPTLQSTGASILYYLCIGLLARRSAQETPRLDTFRSSSVFHAVASQQAMGQMRSPQDQVDGSQEIQTKPASFHWTSPKVRLSP